MASSHRRMLSVFAAAIALTSAVTSATPATSQSVGHPRFDCSTARNGASSARSAPAGARWPPAFPSSRTSTTSARPAAASGKPTAPARRGNRCPTASNPHRVGAIAIAPSDPKTLYVGMGHPEPRYDIAAGDGMYKSTDGGAHWQHAGLQTTRHIGADPDRPERREHRARRRARPHLRPEPRPRRLPHDRRRRDVEEGALRRQPDRRRRSRRRSRRSEDRLRDDVDRAQLALAQLLHADRRRGQRDLEIDRRR